MWLRWASFLIPVFTHTTPEGLIASCPVAQSVVMCWKIGVRQLLRSDHADGDTCVGGCWFKVIMRQWIERRRRKG